MDMTTAGELAPQPRVNPTSASNIPWASSDRTIPLFVDRLAHLFSSYSLEAQPNRENAKEPRQLHFD